MKKLTVALVLVIVLTASLVTPAFAGEPPEDNPGLTTYGPGWYGLVLGAMIGIYKNWTPGVGTGMHTIFELAASGPPVKWQWGNGNNK